MPVPELEEKRLILEHHTLSLPGSLWKEGNLPTYLYKQESTLNPSKVWTLGNTADIHIIIAIHGAHLGRTPMSKWEREVLRTIMAMPVRI